MKKIGLLIPSTNLTVEYELQYLFYNKKLKIDEFVFYIVKLQYKTSYKKNKEKFLSDLSKDIENRVEELRYLNVDYMAFFCTVSAINNKEATLLNNPAQALIEEAIYKCIGKCLLITPYDKKLGCLVKDILEKNNIEVKEMVNFDLLDTHEYFRFGNSELEKFIESTYSPIYGNVIISCTNIPTIHFIERLEKKLNTKVISSNLSLISKILRDNR